jgi:hypothetical protein
MGQTLKLSKPSHAHGRNRSVTATALYLWGYDASTVAIEIETKRGPSGGVCITVPHADIPALVAALQSYVREA